MESRLIETAAVENDRGDFWWFCLCATAAASRHTFGTCI